jgi:hypothetical protein
MIDDDPAPYSPEYDWPIAVAQFTMSRIMEKVELQGSYGRSLMHTIRAICARHTDRTVENIPVGVRPLARRTGHSTRTIQKHLWTLIEDLGVLRATPETGTLKSGERMVHWGTERWVSRGRQRPVRGTKQRTPPPVSYPPIFDGLYHSSNWDGGNTKDIRTRASRKKKKVLKEVPCVTPVTVQLTRYVAETLSAWLGLPHAMETVPTVIDPVWDGHPLSAARPAWRRITAQLSVGAWHVLNARDRRIAKTMATCRLVASRRTSVTTREGGRRMTRTRLVWRRVPVTREDLDTILARLPDQGDAARDRAAHARAAKREQAHPHVKRTRATVALFATLARERPKRLRLRAQSKRYRARMAAENARIRAAALVQFQPELEAERKRTAPREPEIISPDERRAFVARHAVTDDNERIEDVSYALSRRRKDRDPAPEPERDLGVEAAKRMGFTDAEIFGEK